MSDTQLFTALDNNVRSIFQTSLGRAYHMDSLHLMSYFPDSSIDLIITSPPYALVRKKEYGNEDADRYVEWLLGFAKEFWRVLKDRGSLVINIGGAYIRGQPTRSLCHFEVPIRLCRDYHFHLAQEFYWFNPAKMPAPAQWVTIERIRVRDSVEPIWWLSKVPKPQANNRNVLTEYSDSMKRLLKEGYNKGKRPSGHVVSDKWGRDQGGAIPPNVLEFLDDEEETPPEMLTSNLIKMANTSSADRYRRMCREHGVSPHPATFPVGLPRFFIKFLTGDGGVVFDPFGGSSTTGAAAEMEGRRWITSDTNLDYVESARFRFSHTTT